MMAVLSIFADPFCNTNKKKKVIENRISLDAPRIERGHSGPVRVAIMGGLPSHNIYIYRLRLVGGRYVRNLMYAKCATIKSIAQQLWD